MHPINDPQAALERFGIWLTETKVANEFECLCPFHADAHPSCHVNLAKQVFHCVSCSASGDLVKLISGKIKVSRSATLGLLERETPTEGVVEPDKVEVWHQALLKTPTMLETLRVRKGLTPATVRAFSLGLHRGRVTVPVYDDSGEIVNVRRWSPTSKTAKMVNLEGHGQARLYPIRALDREEVLLTEGEMKALLLIQEGFNAISPTGGAETWSAEWGPLFADKVVFVIYDIDAPGVTGGLRAAKAIRRYSKSVHLVTLPLDPKEYPTGGVDEFFLRAGHSAEDLGNLLKETPPWSPVAEDAVEDQEVHPVSLAQASQASLHGRLVETEVVVSAKDTAPFIVPRLFEVRCPQDKEWCVACPQVERGEDPVRIENTNPVILELVNVPLQFQGAALRKAAGIPRVCEACVFKLRESMNVEEVRLIPQLRLSTEENDHVVRRAFFVGHGIDTNVAYRIRARVVAEPKTQYATLLVYEAEAAVDSLSVYQVTEPEDLRIFQPRVLSAEGIQERLDDVYADLEANVTRIFQRRDLHLFYDLVFHSPLYLTFQGQRLKGWAEGLVIGDSGQGKSETITRLLEHYGVGEKIDVKGASVAGLLGGLQETARRWFVSWGIIPLNDRRLVVLEEVKGMSPEVISKLTDMRSSGIAELTKIEKTKTHARTRLIWISNARSDQQLAAYNFGVMAVKELIGSLEDIRRLDMVIAVASGDVDKGVLNMAERDRPRYPHRFTADLCQRLVLWAWSRRAGQVRFSEAATQAVLDVAHRMGETFVAQIPLVESADQRLKVARLAAALAARTFSTDDAQRVEVHAAHVEFIEKFLTRLFSHPALGYLEYSRLVQGEVALRDEAEVIQAIQTMPYARDMVRQMLDAPGFTIWDLMDWTEVDRDLARTFIGLLIRKNALRRGQGIYVKTPPCIALLKRLEGILENKNLVQTLGEKEEI